MRSIFEEKILAKTNVRSVSIFRVFVAGGKPETQPYVLPS